MKNNNFNETINHFIEIVSLDKDIDLSTFYHNLETLEITIGEYEDIYASGYDNFDNRIDFSDSEHFHRDITHELFHCASTKIDGDITHSGFYEYDDKTKIIKGLGLNEGYTETLNYMFFGNEENYHDAYGLQRFYIKKIEQIINPDKLKNFIFLQI